MRPIDIVRAVAASVARYRAARRRQDDFTCGDCERWRRCDQPPGGRCLARVEQIESARWKQRQRARAMIQAMPWA